MALQVSVVVLPDSSFAAAGIDARPPFGGF
jgi:hypothetical protein